MKEDGATTGARVRTALAAWAVVAMAAAAGCFDTRTGTQDAANGHDAATLDTGHPDRDRDGGQKFDAGACDTGAVEDASGPEDCGASDDTGTSADAGVDDAGTDAGGDANGPYCHWDCFGEVYCDGGTLIQCESAPIPCEYWTGSCPCDWPTITECTAGCVPDDPCVGAVCEEVRPHHAGEPCTTDTDCQPPADENWKFVCGDGGVCTPVHNRSDVGTPCGIPSPHHYEVRHSDKCASGVCLIEDDIFGDGRAYCTIQCKYDWQCPENYGCGAAPTYNPDNLLLDLICWTSPPAIVLSPTCQ